MIGRTADPQATLVRLAALFDFAVADQGTRFVLIRGGSVVCEIRVAWSPDGRVAAIHTRDGGGSCRITSGDLDAMLADKFAMADGMAVYFRNNLQFNA